MNRSYPALRGIAILLVVLNHTVYMVTKYAAEAGLVTPGSPLALALSTILGLGVFAVPIFLFLSGCFFAYAALRSDLKTSYKIVWNNVRHVAIPYLIWSVIFYAEIYLVHGTTFSPQGYVKNLLVGYPFNFVPLLIFYYLVSPLLIRLLRRFGLWVLLFIGIYQVFLMSVVNPQIAGFEAPGFLHVLAPPVLSMPLAEWAIFFPLGLYMVMDNARLQPVAHRLRWLLAGLTALLFALGALDAASVIRAPLARQLCPLPFLLLSATFQRSSFPYVRSLELLGKRAYGIYLTNLLVLDLALVAVSRLIPGVLTVYVLLMPVMFALALLLPLFGMNWLERRLKPVVFRYVFG